MFMFDGWLLDVILTTVFATIGYFSRRIPAYLGITGSDAWAHLFYVRMLRNAEGDFPKKLRGFYFDRDFDYPCLFHWLLARVPARWFKTHTERISPVIAAVTVGFCYVAGIWVGRHSGLSPSQLRWAGIMAAGLYLVTPMTYNAWSGIQDLSERPLAVLLVGLAAVGGALASSGAGYAAPILWVFASCMVPLVSKLGVQTLVLVFPPAGALSGNLYFLLTPIVALPGATLISGGHYLHILNGHLSHLRFYRECLQWRHVAVLRRNTGVIATLKRCLKALSDLKLEAGLKELAYNPIFRALLYFPFIVLVVPAVVEYNGVHPLSSLLWLATCSLGVGLAIGTIRSLRFIGEGDRYLYYGGVIPGLLGLGIVYQIHSLNIGIVGVAVLAAAVGAIELASRSRQSGSSRGEEVSLRTALDAIEQLDVRRVLTIPASYAMAVQFETDKDVVYTANPKDEEKDQWKALYPRYYPYPLEDLAKGHEMFGFDAILVIKKYIDPEYLSDLNLDVVYEFDGLELVHEDASVEVWRV